LNDARREPRRRQEALDARATPVVLLIATGETEPLAPDPLTASLSAQGQRQAARAAEAITGQEVDLLCAASDTASAQTADLLAQALSPAERWDLPDLEPLNRDDLALDPSGSPLPARWSPEQVRFGRERLWVRVTPTWARIEIYARAQGHTSVAIVADPLVLSMLLLSWRDSDWRELEDTADISAGAVLQVQLGTHLSIKRLPT